MLITFITLLFLRQAQTTVPDEIVFWPVKPFIYFEVNDTVGGILPTFYKRLEFLCSPSQEKLANFILIDKKFNQEEFYNILENTSYNTAELKYISGNRTIWFPIFREVDPKTLSAKNLKLTLFMNSPHIAVIVHRSKITISNKIFEAIKRSYQIGSFAFGFILIFSTFVWLFECIRNKDFSRWFFRGLGTSFWWTIVTLATVGYGDIVPKSVIGRIFSILWMVIGILIVSALTGTFSSTISTNSFLSIEGKEIAVLAKSLELSIAQNNYGSTSSKDFNSYEEILGAVNSKAADYGVLNVDVLLNMDFKKKYQNLVIIQLLPLQSPVLMSYGDGTNLMKSGDDDVSKCIEKSKEEVLRETIQKFYKVAIVDNEYPQDLKDFILDNNYIKYPGIAILSLIFVLFMKDFVQLIYNKCKGEKKSKSENNNDVSLTVISNGHSVGEKKYTDKNDINKDISIIKEQIMKLNAMSMYKQKCPVCSWQM